MPNSDFGITFNISSEGAENVKSDIQGITQELKNAGAEVKRLSDEMTAAHNHIIKQYGRDFYETILKEYGGADKLDEEIKKYGVENIMKAVNKEFANYSQNTHKASQDTDDFARSAQKAADIATAAFKQVGETISQVSKYSDDLMVSMAKYLQEKQDEENGVRKRDLISRAERILGKERADELRKYSPEEQAELYDLWVGKQFNPKYKSKADREMEAKIESEYKQAEARILSQYGSEGLANALRMYGGTPYKNKKTGDYIWGGEARKKLFDQFDAKGITAVLDEIRRKAEEVGVAFTTMVKERAKIHVDSSDIDKAGEAAKRLELEIEALAETGKGVEWDKLWKENPLAVHDKMIEHFGFQEYNKYLKEMGGLHGLDKQFDTKGAEESINAWRDAMINRLIEVSEQAKKTGADVSEAISNAVSDQGAQNSILPDKLREFFNRLSQETQRGATKMHYAMKRVLTNIGNMVNSFFSKMKKMLLNPITAALGAGAAFNDYMNQTGTLRRLKNAYGIDIEQAQVWGQAAARTGGSAENFYSSIEGLNRMVSRAAQGLPTRYFGKALESLNIDAKTIKSPFDLLEQLADKAQDMEHGHFAGIAQMLGLDSGTIVLLRKGRTEIEKLKEEVRDLGLYTDEDLETTKHFKVALADLKQSMQQIGAVLFKVVIPPFRLLAVTLARLSKTVREHKSFWIVMFTAITVASLAFTKAMYGNVFNKLTGWFLSLGKTVFTFATNFINWGWGILKSPWGWIPGLILAIALVIEDFIGYLNGYETAFGEFWEKLGEAEEISKKIGKAIEWFKEKVSAAIDILPKLVSWLTAAFLAFSALRFLVSVISLFDTLATTLVALNPVVAAIIGVIASLAFLAYAVHENWETVGPFFKGMWEDIVAAFDWGYSKVKPVIDYLISGVDIIRKGFGVIDHDNMYELDAPVGADGLTVHQRLALKNMETSLRSQGKTDAEIEAALTPIRAENIAYNVRSTTPTDKSEKEPFFWKGPFYEKPEKKLNLPVGNSAVQSIQPHTMPVKQKIEQKVETNFNGNITIETQAEDAKGIAAGLEQAVEKEFNGAKFLQASPQLQGG